MVGSVGGCTVHYPVLANEFSYALENEYLTIIFPRYANLNFRKIKFFNETIENRLRQLKGSIWHTREVEPDRI